MQSVEHTFLVSGHSYLYDDRDFALIEEKKKKSILHEPKDLHDVIRRARKVPFSIVEIRKFYNFKDGAEYFLNTTKISISNAVWIRITTPGKVELKRAFDDGPFETFNV